MRDITPAYTIISSLQDESSSRPHSPSLSVPRALSLDEQLQIDLSSDPGDDTDMPDTRPIARERDEDDSSSSTEPSEEDDESNISAHSSGQHPLLRFSRSQDNVRPWAQWGTIRHSNMVRFSFRHFAVPEETEPLQVWLDSFQPAGGSIQFSRAFLRYIETSNTLTITMNGILQLENLWMRTTHQPSSKNDKPILAWIWFHSYIRHGDWQVVRELKCLTISQRTITSLAAIAGFHRSLSPHDWDAHRCHCLTTDALSLRSYCGKDSIMSALLALSFRLESFFHTNGEFHFRWVKGPNHEANAATLPERFWRWIDPETDILVPEWRYRSVDSLEELSSGTIVPPFMTPYLRPKTSFGVRGAVLVRKPCLLPETMISATYCLMIFDEMDFNDEPSLGEKIIEVARSGDIYVGRPNGEIERIASPSEAEKTVLKLWAGMLRGNALVDVEWPT